MKSLLIVQSIFKWNTISSSSSPISTLKQSTNSTDPTLPTPPARKRIGPKAKTFVSHMTDENPLPINSFISDNKEPDQDLIKWWLLKNKNRPNYKSANYNKKIYNLCI